MTLRIEYNKLFRQLAIYENSELILLIYAKMRRKGKLIELVDEKGKHLGYISKEVKIT